LGGKGRRISEYVPGQPRIQRNPVYSFLEKTKPTNQTNKQTKTKKKKKKILMTSADVIILKRYLLQKRRKDIAV
jgi:hypothetical protein